MNGELNSSVNNDCNLVNDSFSFRRECLIKSKTMSRVDGIANRKRKGLCDSEDLFFISSENDVSVDASDVISTVLLSDYHNFPINR